ncbi:hypothetical protein EIN_336910 [Entamoeba invadens IP1]|uniref:Uncharacterized protein n=1 Tax=Entamoeba invadens IP1 TaxID=370355 RepID=L7FM37_ENTIV|nr:hypothetical protein EIN_336910 [Entamoeba invadens IP1]ELP85463.1 hypothetical protein EIN_336910 [Entamoeba invadens IP1]|eukprot:XP_004184809.1 hypothetical protein EIN_336910 [Entamoeba invadens IP1]
MNGKFHAESSKIEKKKILDAIFYKIHDTFPTGAWKYNEAEPSHVDEQSIRELFVTEKRDETNPVVVYLTNDEETAMCSFITDQLLFENEHYITSEMTWYFESTKSVTNVYQGTRVSITLIVNEFIHLMQHAIDSCFTGFSIQNPSKMYIGAWYINPAIDTAINIVDTNRTVLFRNRVFNETIERNDLIQLTENTWLSQVETTLLKKR